MKTIKIVGVFFLAFAFVFSPLSFSNIFALGQSVSVEEITGYQEWNQRRMIDKNVVVRSGATLVIGKGVELDVTSPAITISVQGNLFVKGTVKLPVVIKSTVGQGGFSIVTATNSNVMIRNTEISNGGTQAFMVEKPNINRAVAASYQGAIQINGGTIDIQNATFKNNVYAVVVGSSAASVRVNRSRFVDNGFDVEAYSGGNADFQYNWWGTPDGPQQICYNYSPNYQYCYYEKIYGNFNYSNQLTKETFRDPVLIVPGIMGSWKMTQKSDLELDPVSGTYDELVKTFEKNGYEKEKDLFVFPYEWRNSNVDTAQLLKAKIEEIKTKTHWPKLDIVAHSMGGLVAREYIETLNGGGSVDQLVTLGTPHDGSPKSYLMWDGGEFSSPSRFSIFDFFANKVFEQEAEENGYQNVFQYIRGIPISSIRELLPIYSYLKDSETGIMRTYPNLYPKNLFLENLKTSINLAKFVPIEFTNVVGKMNSDETIGKIRVDGASIELLSDPEKTVLWGHGKPDGYDSLFGDRGLELGTGDGTVPLDSAKDIVADETIEVGSEHGSIPSDAAKMVLNILTGVDAVSDSLQSPLPTSILLAMPFSPVDIEVVSPSGLRVGKDFVTGETHNEISGAYYTGYDTKNEFITIPNPEKGEYKILTQGTDTGSYRVEVSSIQEDASGKASESTVTIRGTAEVNQENENSVEVKTTGEVVMNNQDVTAPVTRADVSGTIGTNDWYTSDATVILTAQDEVGGTGIEKTEYSLDNGTSWNVYANPFVVSTEGTTAVQYLSTDKQGNKEEVKTETIKIDKTAPEAKVVFNPTTQKLDIIGTDNLSQNISVTMVDSVIPPSAVNSDNKEGPEESDKNSSSDHSDDKDVRTKSVASITDEAGHITILTFGTAKDKERRIVRTLESVSYDGVVTPLSKTSLQYGWSIEKRKNLYTMFASNMKVGSKTIESHYIPKKNETWIMEESRDLTFDENDDVIEHRPVRTKLPGMIIPSMTTEKGVIKINY